MHAAGSGRWCGSLCSKEYGAAAKEFVEVWTPGMKGVSPARAIQRNSQRAMPRGINALALGLASAALAACCCCMGEGEMCQGSRFRLAA